MASRNGPGEVVTCPSCNATYRYPSEAAVDGTVRCMNCGRPVKLPQGTVVRCPACFSENVSVKGDRMTCAECGFSEAVVPEGWQRIRGFSLDLLPKYLKKWKECWNKVKGLYWVGMYLTIGDLREISIGETVIIILLLRLYNYRTAAAIRFNADWSECLFTILGTTGPSVDSMDIKLSRAFMMSVSACNDSESEGAAQQALEQQ